MIHALVVANDGESAELISKLARLSEQVVIERLFCPEPRHPELSHVLNTLPLDVVLLDLSHPGEASLLLDQIREKNPALPVAGFCFSGDEPAPLTPFLLPMPLSPRGFIDTIRGAIHASRKAPYPNVFAILPAKAGAGASTIAVNAAAQVAASCGKKVAVADADLRSGIMAESLGLRAQEPIEETLPLADAAHSLIWPRHVAQKSGVDFLLTSRGKAQIQWHDYHHLIKFLSRRYDSVVIDLPEALDDANLESVRAASCVYIATTPEFLSLTLARQRIVEMETANVDRSRIRILVNRWHARDLKPADVATLLGCPVEAVFPNDYPAVHAAIEARSLVDARTRLGAAYRSFAVQLAGGEPARVDAAKGSLLGALRWSMGSSAA
ncbi:MAG: P-loop NTPase [Acidobacteriia bacterium]|nr:P-loop NTPase [Terriglobia bacterium]